MKIAAITDIHGNLPALQAVLRDIDAEGVDLIVNCGDTLGGPLESAKTADRDLALRLAGKGNFGFNAANDTYGDMIEMGILDPTKVTRTAL